MATQPRIIKADQLAGVQPASFNTTDTLREMQKRVDEAGQQIEQYKQSARAEASKMLEQARKEGYQAGYQEGLDKGTAQAQENHQKMLEQETERRLQPLSQALSQVVQRLTQARELWLGEWERLGIELACAIAGRVVRGKVAAASDEIARKALVEALSLVGRTPEVTIFLHPADQETLELNRAQWDAATRSIDQVNVVADPSLSPGGCRIETEFGAIDASIDAQLARIERELIGIEEEPQTQ